jgi:hypothetical protein
VGAGTKFIIKLPSQLKYKVWKNSNQ